MFSELLIKSIQIGEKIFHILCDKTINVEELEKFGVEVIRMASQIKEASKSKEEESPKEEVKEEQPAE